jgi:hypothetical protein
MSSASYTWNPDARIRAIGERARVRHQWARRTGPGEQVEPYPAVKALRDAIVRPWPGITSGGMKRDASRIGTTNNDPHKAGIAIDFMVRSGPDRAANGESLANFLVENMELLQLQYILWAGTEISTSNMGQRWEAYRGAEGHGDHLHVEIGPDAQGWSREEMASRIARAMQARGNAAPPAPPAPPALPALPAPPAPFRLALPAAVSAPASNFGAILVVVAAVAGLSAVGYAIVSSGKTKKNPRQRR